MDFGASENAPMKRVRCPLKVEAQQKLFKKHFNAGDKGKRGFKNDCFLSILKKLDERTLAETASFENFENVISVALREIDSQIGQVEWHRLVETILKTRRSFGHPANYRVANIE